MEVCVPMAVWTEVTAHMCDRPRLGSKATNQSQSFPPVFLILFFFLYIYFFVVVEFYFIFNSLFSSDTVALLISKWCDRLLMSGSSPAVGSA